jgi:hypothetical protein
VSVLKMKYFRCAMHLLESYSFTIGVGICDWGDDKDY